MWAFRAATRVGVSRVRWNSVSRVFMCMTHTSVAIPCVSRSLDDLAGSIADARAAHGKAALDAAVDAAADWAAT